MAAKKKKAKLPKFPGKLVTVDIVVTKTFTMKKLIVLTKKTDPKAIAKLLQKDEGFDEIDGDWSGVKEKVDFKVSKPRATTKKEIEAQKNDSTADDSPYGDSLLEDEVAKAYKTAGVDNPGYGADFEALMPLLGFEPMPEPPAEDPKDEPAADVATGETGTDSE